MSKWPEAQPTISEIEMRNKPVAQEITVANADNTDTRRLEMGLRLNKSIVCWKYEVRTSWATEHHSSFTQHPVEYQLVVHPGDEETRWASRQLLLPSITRASYYMSPVQKRSKFKIPFLLHLYCFFTIIKTRQKSHIEPF